MAKATDPFKIAELIFLEIKGEQKEADQLILDRWKNERPENKEMYEKIVSEKNIIDKVRSYQKIDRNKAWERIAGELDLESRNRVLRIASVMKYAAAVLLMMAIGSYFLLKKPAQVRTEVALNTVIPPGTQKAVLTTSDNRRIELGEKGRKQVFQLTTISVTDTNSMLIFGNETSQNSMQKEIAFSTIQTPAGGEYTMVLSDGTKIFLNAETKLSFPEIFAKDIREVSIEGEAYFEVAKSGNRPFVVKTTDYDIRVFGTSFNVSAYPSDVKNHTTLVEGSVQINIPAENGILLKPGEQASFNKNDKSVKTRKVDTYVYTSWKEGKFVFDNETLEEIMQRLGRWYNTEAAYRDEEIRKYHFTGTLDRYDNISQVLDIISQTTHIEFTVSGKVIVADKKK